MALFFAARTIEQIVYKWLYNAEAFDSVDGMWLFDGPKNRIIINALLVTKGEMDHQHLRGILVKKLRLNDKNQHNNPYKKIKKRIHNGFFNSYWADDEKFDMENHFQIWRETIRSKSQLRHLISTLSSRKFDKSRSPWEFAVIPYIDDTGVQMSAILARVHHCMADGVSLARFLIKELPDTEAVSLPLRKFSERDRLFLMLKGLLWTPYYMLNMLTLPADSSLLHGRELSGQKMATWSEPIDLSIIKEIKNRTSSTVNDVIVTCLTAAIRDFYENRGIKSPENVNIVLPVDLRANMEEAAMKFENKFSVITLQLATGIKDLTAMLHDTKRRLNEMKTSGEPFFTRAFMKMFNVILPGKLLAPANKFICDKTTGIMSNVPGPQNRLNIAGRQLEMLTFWAPPKDSMGLSFSFATYANQLTVGIMSDFAVLQDPDEICKEYQGKVMQLWELSCKS
eukprot:gene20049-22016_t